MNNIKIKKNPTTEIKQKIKKSKFDVLTNEKDFLVKNLKKAG
jgi:malate/lactate dehydrogenase